MNGDYTEYFWLPILGPSATWLVRRCAALVADSPHEVEIDAHALAASLGMSYVPGKFGPFVRALQRAIMFNFVQPSPLEDELLYVRTVAPPLPNRLANRLHESTRSALHNWHESTIEVPVA